MACNGSRILASTLLLVFQLNVDDFINAMQEIIHIPLESLMQILCFLNYILNNEKCSLQDVFINDSLQKQFSSYLSKRFKAESNMTLTDFILNKKIKEAKYLLHYTNKSLTAISVYLGFSSPGHFSRVFRKYASLSPNEYRKKYITWPKTYYSWLTSDILPICYIFAADQRKKIPHAPLLCVSMGEFLSYSRF